MKANAWKDGAGGLCDSGHTLLRATGIGVAVEQAPFAQDADIQLVEFLEAASVKGSGDRSSQAQKAVSGRPRPSMMLLMRANPAASGTGLREGDALDAVAGLCRDAARILEDGRDEAVSPARRF